MLQSGETKLIKCISLISGPTSRTECDAGPRKPQRQPGRRRSLSPWPDLVIFESSWQQIFPQKAQNIKCLLGYFEDVIFKQKLLGYFCNHLGYFLFQHLVTLTFTITI